MNLNNNILRRFLLATACMTVLYSVQEARGSNDSPFPSNLDKGNVSQSSQTPFAPLTPPSANSLIIQQPPTVMVNLNGSDIDVNVGGEEELRERLTNSSTEDLIKIIGQLVKRVNMLESNNTQLKKEEDRHKNDKQFLGGSILSAMKAVGIKIENGDINFIKKNINNFMKTIEDWNVERTRMEIMLNDKYNPAKKAEEKQNELNNKLKEMEDTNNRLQVIVNKCNEQISELTEKNEEVNKANDIVYAHWKDSQQKNIALKELNETLGQQLKEKGDEVQQLKEERQTLETNLKNYIGGKMKAAEAYISKRAGNVKSVPNLNFCKSIQDIVTAVLEYFITLLTQENSNEESFRKKWEENGVERLLEGVGMLSSNMIRHMKNISENFKPTEPTWPSPPTFQHLKENVDVLFKGIEELFNKLKLLETNCNKKIAEMYKEKGDAAQKISTQIFCKDSDIKHLTVANKKLTQESNKLTQERDKLKQENKSLTQENKNLKQENKSLTQEKENLTQENESLKQQLDVKEEQIKNLPKKNTQPKKNRPLVKQDEQFNKLLSEMDDAVKKNQESESLKELNIENQKLKNEGVRLQNELNQQNQELSNLQTQLDEVKNQLQNEKLQNQSLHQLQNQKDADNQNLNQQI
jgi:chromosome segregation ATPase